MQRELDRIALELARRQLHEKIRYFQPNGGQERFIQEISREGPFIVVNGSGNGAGKSYGIIAILAALCWPKIAPHCFAAPIFQNWPYPKRARICSTPKELEEIGSIQAAIKELFPRGRFEANKKGKSYPSQFITDTGWIIDVFSYEQDKSEMAGPTIGLLIWNEPMPEDLWREGIARMRKGGITLVAMTSLIDNPWVVDGILSKSDGDKVRVIYADIEENCKTHGKNGTLEHDQIERILAQYDPDEREARKTGKPLSLSGRIYKTFDRDAHVIEPESIPGGVSHYLAVDPAIGKPLACVLGYVDRSGVVTIYDEYPEFEFHGAKDSNLTVTDYARIFKQKEMGREFERVIDRHFAAQRHGLGGRTLKEEFAEAGVFFRDSYSVAADIPEVETGILKVKEYLKYDKTKAISALNRPKIRIFNTCKNTIASFEKWSRDAKTLRPKDEYKDFADAVRYLLCANPEVYQEKDWSGAKQPHYGVGNI